MLVVYIAGPFRGETTWDVERNVRRAEEAALEIARMGAMPLCPHANTRYFHGQLSPEFWLEGTLELLRRCDVVVVLYGWEDSEGTKAEVKEAEDRGIPVLKYDECEAAIRRMVANGDK